MRTERVGFAMCGSFCTHAKALAALEELCGAYETVIPIVSEICLTTDTRFGTAEALIARVEELTGRRVMASVAEAVVALATNDGLSGAAKNIGELLNRKHYYFVPFGQDDPVKKPCSLMADFSRVGETLEAALEGRQLQPVLLR